MISRQNTNSDRAFSLVEVVIAMGIVSFSVLATIGLLSVANDTSKNARDEGMAARLASNEFDRIRSLSAKTFPTAYATRYFDSDLKDLGTSKTFAAVYAFSITFVPSPANSGTADEILNAEVACPVQAAKPQVFRFTTLVNIPTS